MSSSSFHQNPTGIFTGFTDSSLLFPSCLFTLTGLKTTRDTVVFTGGWMWQLWSIFLGFSTFLVGDNFRYFSPTFHFYSILWSSAKYRWMIKKRKRKHSIVSIYTVQLPVEQKKEKLYHYHFVDFVLLTCIMCSV